MSRVEEAMAWPGLLAHSPDPSKGRVMVKVRFRVRFGLASGLRLVWIGKVRGLRVWVGLDPKRGNGTIG